MTDNEKIPARAILFIDGNNFYHGMKDVLMLPSMELDYGSFSRKLIGKDREWIETRYYVGQVRQEGDTSRYWQQRAFLRWLQSFDRVSCHLGRLERRIVEGDEQELGDWLDTLQKRSDINVPAQAVKELRLIAANAKVTWVEKAVDVMIATDMVAMAYDDQYDNAYLISADGDFTPAVKKVRDTGRKVFVASPMHGAQLAKVANAFIRLPREFFHGCWDTKVWR